ncbi:hypothetical protein ABH905_001579 [Pseudomonas frederiksbergensis]|uniref:hypothetical protein n=1 Tax=Pseudomonas frederiksbergensis TaxID=104087 RepID=UPI003D2048BF
MDWRTPVGAAEGCDLFQASTKAGDFWPFRRPFFCPEKDNCYIHLKYNKMNKYDLWIYKSAVKVTLSTRDRKPRIANAAQGIV